MQFHLLTIAILAPSVFGHGYIKWIGVDNVLYPGFNPYVKDFKIYRAEPWLTKLYSHVDAQLGAKRIAFGQSYGNHPRYAPDNVMSKDIACGSHSARPALSAPARAGSNITFGWSTWPITHRGPYLNYMGRY